MSILSRLFGAPRCYCGSGLEAGFCSHRTATRAGTTRNGHRDTPTLRNARTPKRK
jgi:hypothetical protein